MCRHTSKLGNFIRFCKMEKPIFTCICIITILFYAGFCAGQSPQVTLQTNFGDIVIELFDSNAPITVANFSGYVNSGFYDGLIFHRVIDGFVIQAGLFDQDFNPRPTADPIVNEFGISNLRGTVAMAKIPGDPNSATSQFFVNLSDNTHLDTQNGGFTVFGQVISDMNVVDNIAGIETDSNDVPTGPNSPVIIYSAKAAGNIAGDINGDFGVNFFDLAILGGDWKQGQKESLQDSNVIVSEAADISGEIYVWQNEDRDIYGCNLPDADVFAVCTNADDQLEPAIDGDIVIWRDSRDSSYDIYGYNLSNGIEFVVSNLNSSEREPAVSNNIVLWRDYRNYHTDYGQGKLKTDIYAADITDINNPVVFAVCTAVDSQMAPAIDGNIVVWDDYRTGEHDIYAADISDPNEPNEFAVCTAAGKQCNPVISGNTIVWEDWRYGNAAIFGYDLSAETEFSIAFGEIAGVDIANGIVVWQDKRSGNWDIYGYDVSADIEFAIIIADGNQVEPVISGDIAAWRDLEDGGQLHWRRLCSMHYTGDINGDCKVDISDLAIIASNWLQCGLQPSGNCWE